ncbi:50S ribosomal protein L18 [Candidatus Vidania fulgoroideorum]
MKSSIKIKSKKNRKKYAYKNSNVIIINKTNQNIHLQIFSFSKKRILTSCSSIEKNIKSIFLKKGVKTNSFYSCYIIGKILAFKILSMKIKNVIFDRSGYKFHGKVKKIYDTLFFFLKKKW